MESKHTKANKNQQIEKLKIKSKSPDFLKIFLNLSQFWSQFGEILKNQPIHIPNFAFYKGSFIYQETDFATHDGSMSLQGLLYWVPPGVCNLSMLKGQW